MSKSKLQRLYDGKERSYIIGMNRYLLSNLRKDRDKCLILKGKLEMLEEQMYPNGRNTVVPPKIKQP